MEENITIEFVKEWIEKHNLSKGSFDRIMNDLIYNSGHYYIDDPSLRYWLIDNTYKFRDMLPVDLNENQQKYLKELQYNRERLGNAHDALFFGLVDYEKRWNFNDKDFIQLLAAFAEWGMKNDK